MGVWLGDQVPQLGGSPEQGHFLTTASGAGEAKTRHWRRAEPLRKAGAECKEVTTGGAGLEIVDQSEERAAPHPKATPR